METIKYIPQGVCSRAMEFDIEDGVIQGVRVEGGCNGNLKGIARLLVGEKASVVAEKLSGVTCGMRNTSCPDQMAKALKAYLAK